MSEFNSFEVWAEAQFGKPPNQKGWERTAAEIEHEARCRERVARMGRALADQRNTYELMRGAALAGWCAGQDAAKRENSPSRPTATTPASRKGRARPNPARPTPKEQP